VEPRNLAHSVSAPAIWALWAALAILVIGFLLTFAFPGKPGTGHTAPEEIAGLAAAEQGPQKL
jgi:hypothetical protein